MMQQVAQTFVELICGCESMSEAVFLTIIIACGLECNHKTTKQRQETM
jgi:hypothetical protein